VISLLRQPTLRRFFIAHGQSQLGTGAGYVALVLIAYQRLHSGWGVAVVLLADFLPGAFLSAHFGALADRYSRRKLAVAAELLRGCAFLALAVTSSFSATVVLALLAGVGTALFRPAVGAALPELVANEERGQATSLYGGLQTLGITAGPALCGLILLFGPVNWVLALNGITFLASGWLLLGVPFSQDQPQTREKPAARTGEAVRVLAEHRGLATVLAVGAAVTLCAAAINVVEPILAAGPLHAGRSGFSLLVTVYGLGLVAGTGYTSRLGSNIATLRAHFLAGAALSAVAMLACAAAGNLAEALVPFALGGLANGVVIGPQVRLLQELVADSLRGRIFGIRETSECTCFVIAFLAAGGLVDMIGPRGIYLMSGGLMLAAAGLGLLVFREPRAGDAVRLTLRWTRFP
jgi:MFS family permease